MTVSELREMLEGADGTEVAFGLPTDGGVMPVPLDSAGGVTDRDGNFWLLLFPPPSCGGGCEGCGGCPDDGRPDDEGEA